MARQGKRALAGVAGVLALVLAVAGALFETGTEEAKAGRPDAYVLALSWSPSYCLDEGSDDRDQCGTRRPRAYSFVTHGLWPQGDGGNARLEYCEKPAPWVDEDVIAEVLDTIPTRRLALHQWRKHGTCSGLDAAAYFDLTETARARIRIPDAMQRPTAPVVMSQREAVEAFVRVNPDLPANAIVLDCGNRTGQARLREVRFCLDGSLAPRACTRAERTSCRADTLILPPVR